MNNPKRVVIGTRGSNLALIQTAIVEQTLSLLYPDIAFETKIIQTKGDTDHSPIPLDTVGKAWFTKEIEDALLRKEIDLAVHSLKDVPPELPKGLKITPVMQRADPRDVLVSRHPGGLVGLPKNAVVGTDSIRRKAALLAHRSDLIVESVRGNVDSRLQKLQDKSYDALVLAAAGLDRLGKSDVISEYLDPAEFVPAIGQAVLAVEARSRQRSIWQMLERMRDPDVIAAYNAEQIFSEKIGGGCKLPVGCYVYFDGPTAYIYGMVGSMDAKKMIVGKWQVPKIAVLKATRRLAADFIRDNQALVESLGT